MMTKNQIFKVIKSNLESHIPATLPKVNWSDFVIETPVTVESPVNERKKPFFGEFKLAFMSLLAFALVIIGLNVILQPGQPTLTNPYQVQANQTSLSISAVSTASIASNIQASQISYNAAVSYIQALSTSQSTSTLEPYLEMIETITGQNANIGIESVPSDNPDYAYKTTLTSIDLVGDPIVFNLYFNTLSYSESDQKTSYSIEGIFLYNDSQFDFTGSQVISDEQSTLYFKTTSDTNNYVESTLNTQDNASTYHLKIVQNGSITSESQLQIEESNNEKVIHLAFHNGSDEGQYQIKYENEDNQNILKVEYETQIQGITEAGQMKISVVIDPVTGLSSYQIIVKPNEEPEYEYSSDRKIHEKDHPDESDSSNLEPSENTDD